MKNAFELTAIKRTSLSIPVRNLLKKRIFNESHTVLDYGCGHGYDLTELNKIEFNISGYDKFNPEFINSNCELIKNDNENPFEIIVCNYVFNVIANNNERQKLIDVLRKSISNVYIAVRSDKTAIKSSWRYDNDNGGYHTTKGSFQRFYDLEMVRREFGRVQIITENKSYIQFKLL